MCISNMLSIEADAAGLGTTVCFIENQLVNADELLN